MTNSIQSNAPRFYTMLVGPEKATQLLVSNTKNRKLSPRIVEKYARDMAHGNWINNGDVVRISVDGVLLDGQHRLSAIVMSGVTIPVNFVEGLDPDAFTRIDTGHKRTIGAIAGLTGFANSHAASAIAKRLIQWENTADKSRFTFSNGFFSQITEKDILGFMDTYDDEIQSMFKNINNALPHRKCGAPSALVAALIICQRYNTDAASSFVSGLITGANLTEFSPIAALRDKLVDPPERRGLFWEVEVMALTIKSFSYHVKGKPLKYLRWIQGGDNPEKFPTLG